MTPKFLRAEAARFREMAETTDRAASRQRLLGMASDYESRADAAVEAQPLEQAPDAEPAPEDAVAIKAAKPTPAERRTRSPRTLTLPDTSSTPSN
jgi:hypothetical protein